MSRARVINGDLFYYDAELYDCLGPIGCHLYIILWCIADDSGVYEPKYGDIALKSGVLRLTTIDVQGYIEKLLSAGKVISFISDGREYHWLKNFHKHQPLKNPSLPRLPVPAWIKVEECEYASKKKYAKYEINAAILAKYLESLPEGYWKPTSTRETKRKEKKPILSGRLPDTTSLDIFKGKKRIHHKIDYEAEITSLLTGAGDLAGLFEGFIAVATAKNKTSTISLSRKHTLLSQLIEILRQPVDRETFRAALQEVISKDIDNITYLCKVIDSKSKNGNGKKPAPSSKSQKDNSIFEAIQAEDEKKRSTAL